MEVVCAPTRSILQSHVYIVKKTHNNVLLEKKRIYFSKAIKSYALDYIKKKGKIRRSGYSERNSRADGGGDEGETHYI